MANHFQTSAKHIQATDCYWQIPTMGNRRLQYLRYQVTQRRKSTQMLNDRLRDSNLQFVKLVERERRNKAFKCVQETMPVTKHLIEIRGLQKILKEKRESLAMRHHIASSPYGLYDGESVKSYKREIDRVILEEHPKIRRLRKVQKIKSDSILQGKIVNYGEAMKQLKEVLSKPNKKSLDLNQRKCTYPIEPYHLLKVIPSPTVKTRSCQYVADKIQVVESSELSRCELPVHRLNAEFRHRKSKLVLPEFSHDFFQGNANRNIAILQAKVYSCDRPTSKTVN